MKRGGSLSTKIKCWDCNTPAVAFLIESTSGNQICLACAQSKGLDLPIVASDEEIGTIEKRTKRGRTTKTA